MANSYVEQDKRKRYNAASGWTTIRTWQGPESEYTDFDTNTLPVGYSELELTTTQDGWITVEASYAASTFDGSYDPGDAGLVSRTWSMVVNEEEKPLILLPKIQALTQITGGASWPMEIQIGMEQWRKACKVAIDNHEATMPLSADYLPPVPAAATTPQRETAVQFALALLKTDNPVFAVPTYVLRKTEVVMTWTALKAVHTNVNRFHSYAGLTSAEPTLPSAALIDAASLSALYWLKRPAKVENITFGQMQIEQEWWGAAEFDSFIYGTAIT